MGKKEILTKAEIHHFGIEIVQSQMQQDGFEIIGVNPSMTVTPQIVARRNGRLCFVVVRTDFYPNRAGLTDEREFFYNLDHAEKNNALCYFAGLRLCNARAADRGDEEGMSLPVKGADFYVEYEGLKIMTALERMKIRDGQELRGLNEVDVKPGPGKGVSETARSAASQK
jgi:hypothetical protein